MNFKNSISLKAGKKALKILKKDGLKVDDISVVAGAAGGPKWLILRNLDRAIFGTWLKDRKTPLPLIGSSIATWRFACIASPDPESAFQKFEDSYIKQSYVDNKKSSFITSESLKIIDNYLDGNMEEVLNHPFYRLNIMTTKCKWPLSSSNKILQVFGFSIAYILNLICRDHLNTLFKRGLFFDKRFKPDFFKSDQFKTEYYKIEKDNFKKALLASGSIPIVMDGVRINQDIYRDGGVLDYNMDLKYENTDKIVLFPHYSDRIIPGWLDKKLNRRKPFEQTLDKMLMISPSEKLINDLPNRKIPDREDFMNLTDSDRIKAWKEVIVKSKVMEDDFLLLTKNKDLLNEVLEPLTN